MSIRERASPSCVLGVELTLGPKRRVAPTLDADATCKAVCSVCLVQEVDEYTEGYAGVCLKCTRAIDEQEEKRLRPSCGCDLRYSPPRLCRPCADAEDAAVDQWELKQVAREQRRLEAM